MKKLNYSIALLFISTVYLFSQTEENKIIQVDTVIRVDTVIVNKPIEQVVSKDDYFYNYYLPSLKNKNDSDTLLLKKNEKLWIFLAEKGVASSDGHMLTLFSIKIPIFNDFHIIPKYSFYTDTYSNQYAFGFLMLGYYFTPYENNKNFVSEISAGLGISFLPFFSADVNLYYRFSEYALLSFGIYHYYLTFGCSLGLGITY